MLILYRRKKLSSRALAFEQFHCFGWLILPMLFCFLLSVPLGCTAADQVAFSYVPSIEGKTYSQLTRGSQKLLNDIELYIVEGNITSAPRIITAKGTYDVSLKSGDVGVLDVSLKSTYSPSAYFISINGTPTHAAQYVNGKPLQFYFSNEIFLTGLAQEIRLDLLKKTRAGWSIMQTVNFKLITKAIVPNPVPTPTPEPVLSGYVPPNTKEWSRYPHNLIINPSQIKIEPTSEAGFNTADPCVMFDKKSNLWHLYFSSMIMSKDVQVIKHAQSVDGATWTVKDGIALDLGPSGNWDSEVVETCSAVSVETAPGVFKYYLFYSGSNTDLGDDKDYYQMGVAVSDNPDAFTRISAVQSPRGAAGLLFNEKDAFVKNPAVVKGIVTDPDVLYQDGLFKIWYFCAGMNSAGNYVDGGICYATSTDGLSWAHMGSLPSLLNEQSVGGVAQQPTVIYNENLKLYEMWFVIDDPAYLSYGISGLAVGGYYHATSPDGIAWTYDSKTKLDFTWDKNLISENKGMANGPEVFFKNGYYYLFYGTFTTQNVSADYYPYVWGLNVATKK
jgi:hypothetical protein